MYPGGSAATVRRRRERCGCSVQAQALLYRALVMDPQNIPLSGDLFSRRGARQPDPIDGTGVPEQGGGWRKAPPERARRRRAFPAVPGGGRVLCRWPWDRRISACPGTRHAARWCEQSKQFGLTGGRHGCSSDFSGPPARRPSRVATSSFAERREDARNEELCQPAAPRGRTTPAQPPVTDCL